MFFFVFGYFVSCDNKMRDMLALDGRDGASPLSYRGLTVVALRRRVAAGFGVMRLLCDETFGSVSINNGVHLPTAHAKGGFRTSCIYWERQTD